MEALDQEQWALDAGQGASVASVAWYMRLPVTDVGDSSLLMLAELDPRLDEGAILLRKGIGVGLAGCSFYTSGSKLLTWPVSQNRHFPRANVAFVNVEGSLSIHLKRPAGMSARPMTKPYWHFF